MRKALSLFAFMVLLAPAISGCGGCNGGSGTVYKVTYDGNDSTGGTVPVDSAEYREGDSVTVLGNTGGLERAGYALNGWSTAADGSGTSYTQGQTFTMGSADVTLYARWTQNPTYTVTYDGNGSTGGSVPVDTTHYQAGQTVFTFENTGNLTRTGYSFNGWNSQADGGGTTYSASFIMGSANVTLYARWTQNPAYTVTYDGNGNTGGTAPVDTTHYEAGQTVTVLGNTGNLTRTGFSFSGWSSQVDGSGTTYGATFTMGSANVTLYAKWTQNPTYTITYNGNGNTGGSAPVDTTHYETGQTVTVLGNAGNLTRPSLHFDGWNTAANGGGTTYAPGQTFAMGSANVTLYARWTPYKVIYNGNGNTGGSAPTDTTNYEPGQTVIVADNTGNLVKTNFVYAGWNTAADGSGTTYTHGQTFAMGTANVILYARWGALAPTFSTAGGIYATTQTVSLSSVTPGVTIYYTTDGSDPSTSSTPYSTSISVTANFIMIKALAHGNGLADSQIATITYSISNSTIHLAPGQHIIFSPYDNPTIGTPYNGIGVIDLVYFTETMANVGLRRDCLSNPTAPSTVWATTSYNITGTVPVAQSSFGTSPMGGWIGDGQSAAMLTNTGSTTIHIAHVTIHGVFGNMASQ